MARTVIINCDGCGKEILREASPTQRRLFRNPRRLDADERAELARHLLAQPYVFDLANGAIYLCDPVCLLGAIDVISAALAREKAVRAETSAGFSSSIISPRPSSGDLECE